MSNVTLIITQVSSSSSMRSRKASRPSCRSLASGNSIRKSWSVSFAARASMRGHPKCSASAHAATMATRTRASPSRTCSRSFARSTRRSSVSSFSSSQVKARRYSKRISSVVLLFYCLLEQFCEV